MIPSLNEVEMTVWKAARGAGLAWGLAEEMGQAARWLADHGFDWAPPVISVLADAERDAGRPPPPVPSDDGAWRPAPGEASASAILCGPLMADMAGRLTEGRPLVFHGVAEPVLMLPFAAAAAAAHGLALAFRADREDFRFAPNCAEGTSRLSGISRAEVAMLSMIDAPEAPERKPFAAGAPRRPIDADRFARLETWVHCTYVPASAQSRLAGAGAGLTDND